MNRKIALLSGARGQDAALLSRFLLDEDWKVIAFERHVQSPDYTNIKDILDHPNYVLEKGDVTDAGSVSRLVSLYKPDHFYHLAANSFVGCSWQEPSAVFQTNAIGTLNCLEAVRNHSPNTKILVASTSETVGNSKEVIQNEETKHSPHSPYAVSKTAAEHMCHVWRFSHKIFACYTRCYNHESIYRGREFVTRKASDWIGRSFNTVENKVIDKMPSKSFISTEQAFRYALDQGYINQLKLGNLNSSRDWLAAEDCVRGMHMVLSLNEPDDFVLASGKMHSIDDFLKIAFNHIGIYDYMPFIGQDPKFMRPDDVVTLCGDYSKAKRILGWEPTISFENLVKTMVTNDIKINSV
jgi:GDPmannose 4,6-dehydratase